MIILGVDISHWQGLVNWQRLTDRGINFAYIKATDTDIKNVKTKWVDPLFYDNWNGASNLGIPRGAYHFWRSNVDPIIQAKLFCNAVGVSCGELAPAIDIEKIVAPPKDLEVRLFNWVEYVEDVYRIRPVIYTNLNTIKLYFKNPKWGQYPLWLSSPSTPAPNIPLPFYSGLWTILQFSYKGNGKYFGASSNDIDLDICQDIDRLRVVGV